MAGRCMGQSNTTQFLIAAIGASAGGLEAYETFFQHMPADAGIAFAVVLHLAPDHASALAQLLAQAHPDVGRAGPGQYEGRSRTGSTSSRPMRR